LARQFSDIHSESILRDCEKYQEFKSSIAARSATLVFSAYYLDAPASAFGHTFLRLNKAPHDFPQSQRRELLDAGINYGAVQTTNNPLLYPLFGLAGLFKGEYSRLPYYFKVREYGDFEARDLWEYNLNLSEDEVELMVAHIWELGQTYFDYFYLTENCSYHMLTLLEAAAPRLSLTENMPPWTIPGDTIRALYQEPNLVESLNYRPSLRSVFASRVEGMDSQSKEWVKRLSASDNASALESFHDVDMEPTQKALVLEAASDFIDYRNPAKTPTGEDRGEWNATKLRILSQRAKLGMIAPHTTPMPETDAPHLGHPSRRWGIRYQNGNAVDSQWLFDFRFALRDRFDPLMGYPPGSELEFFKISTKYDQKSERFTLEELTVLRASTRNPFNSFEQKPSWRFQLTTRRDSLWNCGHCRPFGLEFAFDGYAEMLKDSDLMLTAMIETDILTSSHFDHRFEIFWGPYVELSRRTFDKASFFLSYKGRSPVSRWTYDDRYSVGLNYDLHNDMIKNVQLRSAVRLEREGIKEWDVGFYHYF